jgi:hypothetical protein
MNRQLNRIIGNNETGFDGSADATYRIQGWDFLMAGGALYNNLDYSFTVGHEDGSFAAPEETPGGGSAALRRQLGLLRDFFDAIPFVRMAPADVVKAPEGASARALGDPGNVYAVYLHHGRPVKGAKPQYQVDGARALRTIELRLPEGSYTATWKDTRSPAALREEKVKGTGAWQSIATPAYSEDVALLLRRAR